MRFNPNYWLTRIGRKGKVPGRGEIQEREGKREVDLEEEGSVEQEEKEGETLSHLLSSSGLRIRLSRQWRCSTYKQDQKGQVRRGKGGLRLGKQEARAEASILKLMAAQSCLSLSNTSTFHLISWWPMLKPRVGVNFE